jgi:DnaK suppressor protein
MNQKLLKKLKEKLEKEKTEIEKQLTSFADKDKKLKDDWDTRFPNFTNNETGSGALEQAAGEVEEYNNLLPVEHSLELGLKNINSALKKIKKGKYGICEKCQKEIEEKRIKVYPAAQYCLNCKKLLKK